MTVSSYVDAHVHLRDGAVLADISGAGVAAVRDAGSRTGTALTLRAKAAGGGLRIVTAGRALVKTGGYGSLLGPPVSTRAEIEREIDALAADGADIIKVVASGVVSLREAGGVTAGGFGEAELRAIVSRAAEHGLAVMCHVNGAEAIKHAVHAGVRSIEHGFFMTEDALQAMQALGTFWVPTIGALHRAAAGSDKAVRQRVSAVIDSHLDALAKAYGMGVPLAVGTDCVLPDPRYGVVYQEELDWFRKAGIPDQAVERIAREGGRELLGIHD
jgi:imidazolonepropionase-like amidohydrolase